MIQDAATKATPMIPANASKAELEQLYRNLLSSVVVLARVLGKECPVETRKERRERSVQQREVMVK